MREPILSSYFGTVCMYLPTTAILSLGMPSGAPVLVVPPCSFGRLTPRRSRVRMPASALRDMSRPCIVEQDGRTFLNLEAWKSTRDTKASLRACKVAKSQRIMAAPNAFPVVEPSASLREPQFQANRKSWDPLIEKFQTMCKAAMAQGEDRHTHRHQDRGQLLGKTDCEVYL
jgi:hypothetical protein